MPNAKFYKSFIFEQHQHKQQYTANAYLYHTCHVHRFVHIIHGTVTLYTSQENLQLKENDIFFIPKEAHYSTHWYPDSESRINFYLLGFEQFPSDQNISYKLQPLSCGSDAIALLTELEQDLAVSPLSIGLLYHFIGKVYPALVPSPASGNEVIVNKALEYMRQNDAYHIKDVADHCGICESGLYAKFRKHLNQTPVEARHQILIEKASELLTTTDMAVEEISDHLGFSSSSYFRKIFSARTGKSPSRYRKEYRWI